MYSIYLQHVVEWNKVTALVMHTVPLCVHLITRELFHQLAQNIATVVGLFLKLILYMSPSN